MDKRLKAHFHWPLFWVTLSLSAIGFLNLHSATYDLARGGFSPLFLSQLAWFAIGIVCAFLVLLVDYRVFLRFAYPLYGLSVLLLVAVLYYGKEVAGNRNWLALGPLNLQPSEVMKISFIIILARYFADHPAPQGYRLRDLWVPLLLL